MQTLQTEALAARVQVPLERFETAVASPQAAAPQPEAPSRKQSHSVLPPLNTFTTARPTHTLHASDRSAANARLSLPKSSRSRSQSQRSDQLKLLSAIHVRDFAYPTDCPAYFGHYPEPNSSTTTPASLSSPWESTRSTVRDAQDQQYSYTAQLSLATFSDGPPWAEDEDLHSPIVTSARHKKARSGVGDSEERRGRTVFSNIPATSSFDTVTSYDGYSPQFESYFSQSSSTYDPAYPSAYHGPSTHHDPAFLDDDYTEEEEESRYSKDYQFTIASPDEEMHGKAVALFDFARENENELPLAEGQVIWVSYRHGQGWLVAQDPKSGESGLVPEEYVRLVEGIEGGLFVLNGAAGLESPVQGEEMTDAGVSPSVATAQTQAQSNPAHYTPIRSHFSTSSKDLQPWTCQEPRQQPPPTETHTGLMQAQSTLTDIQTHFENDFQDSMPPPMAEEPEEMTPEAAIVRQLHTSHDGTHLEPLDSEAKDIVAQPVSPADAHRSGYTTMKSTATQLTSRER